MGDDGEKFGAWPDTNEHCWGADGWVERFFAAIEAHPAIVTVTPSDWLGRHRPIGRIYLPTASYFEMGEWALPADQGLAFEAAVKAAEAEKAPWARWLQGGFWRNFQVKYREINDLHKQMLRVSAMVAAMPPGPEAGPGPGSPPPGPVERLLLARRVRRHLHLAHAPGHPRAPHRRRGPGRPDGQAGRDGRRRDRPGRHRPRRDRRDPDHDRRAGRGRRPGRGRRARDVGHPGRPARLDRGHAPPARGVPRPAAGQRIGGAGTRGWSR